MLLSNQISILTVEWHIITWAHLLKPMLMTWNKLIVLNIVHKLVINHSLQDFDHLTGEGNRTIAIPSLTLHSLNVELEVSAGTWRDFHGGLQNGPFLIYEALKLTPFNYNVDNIPSIREKQPGKSILQVPNTGTSQYFWILEHIWCTSIAWKCDIYVLKIMLLASRSKQYWNAKMV